MCEDSCTAEKMPTVLLNLLAADEPYIFAQKKGIRLKDGMIRVVILVDKGFFADNLNVKYELSEFQKKKELVFAYISFDNLKKICAEDSVHYVRLPFEFKRMQ